MLGIGTRLFYAILSKNFSSTKTANTLNWERELGNFFLRHTMEQKQSHGPNDPQLV